MSKKLLIASLVLVMGSAVISYAADSQPTTYTERFIQKHTQKLVDTEKELQQKQQAREEARAKQKEEFQKQIEAREQARAKQKEELQKKIEANQKAREDAANARKQKLEQKRELWNQLISE